jgi:hypothetical protein
MIGVVKLSVVANKLVHKESEYQFISIPATVPAVNNTVPEPHLLLGVVEIIEAKGLIVAFTVDLVPLTHPVRVSLDVA